MPMAASATPLASAGIGGRRVPMTALFRPPFPAPDRPVSQHPALQFGRSGLFGARHLAPQCLGACRPSPATLRPVDRFPCPPWWIVTSTTTIAAPSPWASRPVGDPVIRFMIDVLAHGRCPVRALIDLIGRGLSCGGDLGQPSNSRHKTATEFRRCTVGTARVPLSRGVRALQLSPWCAGLAEPPILQRLRTISAFSTGYVSPVPFRVWVSTVAQKHPSEFLPSTRGIYHVG
jgi:hypothetical protein